MHKSREKASTQSCLCGTDVTTESKKINEQEFAGLDAAFASF